MNGVLCLHTLPTNSLAMTGLKLGPWDAKTWAPNYSVPSVLQPSPFDVAFLGGDMSLFPLKVGCVLCLLGAQSLEAACMYLMVIFGPRIKMGLILKCENVYWKIIFRDVWLKGNIWSWKCCPQCCPQLETGPDWTDLHTVFTRAQSCVWSMVARSSQLCLHLGNL